MSTGGKTKSWEDRYAEIRDFFVAQGHANTTEREQQKLHKWALQQRKQKAQLGEGQIKLLDQINFDWETRAMKNERIWDKHFSVLKGYNQENEHLRVKQTEVYSGHNLGAWVSNQRKAYKKGRLSKERIEKLESIAGFKWADERKAWKDDRNTSKVDAAWDERCDALCSYKQQHGHTMVPPKHMARGSSGEEYGLGEWVCIQRRMCRDGLLKQNRRKKLEEVGFVFVIDTYDAQTSLKQQKWDAMLTKLLDVKEKNITCLVPDPDPSLGNWVSQQRTQHSGSTLDDRRFRKLNAIGFLWSALDDRWNTRLQQLKDFKKAHGHCQVSRKEDAKLATWVSTLRSRRNGKSSKGPLLPERVRQLNKLEFDWQPPPPRRSARALEESSRGSTPKSKRRRKSSTVDATVVGGGGDDDDDRKLPATQEATELETVCNLGRRQDR